MLTFVPLLLRLKMETASNTLDTDRYLEPAIVESTYKINDYLKIKEFVFQKTHLLSTPYYFLFRTEDIIWTLQCVNTKDDRHECTMILKQHCQESKVEDLIKRSMSIDCSIIRENCQGKISVAPVINVFLDEKPTLQEVYQNTYVEEDAGLRSATALVKIYFVEALVSSGIENMESEVVNVYNTIKFLCRQKIFTSSNFNQEAINFLQKNHHRITDCHDFEKAVRAYVCKAPEVNLEEVNNDMR